MKAYGKREVQVHAFLISAFDEDDWSDSVPDHLPVAQIEWQKCLILPFSSNLIPAAVTYDYDLGSGNGSFYKKNAFL